MSSPSAPLRFLAKLLLFLVFTTTLLLFLIAVSTWSFPKMLTLTLASPPSTSPAERTQYSLLAGELTLRFDRRWTQDPPTAPSATPSTDDPYTGPPVASGLSLTDSFPPLTPGANEEFQSLFPGVSKLVRTKPLSPTAAARSSTTALTAHVAYLLLPAAAASTLGLLLLRKKPSPPVAPPPATPSV